MAAPSGAAAEASAAESLPPTVVNGGLDDISLANADGHQLQDAAWKRRRLTFSQQHPQELLQSLGPRLYMEQAKTDLNLALHHQVMAMHKANEEAYRMIAYLTKQLHDANNNYEKLAELVLQKIDYLDSSGVLLMAEWEKREGANPAAAAAARAAAVAGHRKDALNTFWPPPKQ